MRQIDAYATGHKLVDLYNRELTADGKRALRDAMAAVMKSPDIGQKSNDPLTIEELAEMDGESVWVRCLYDKRRSGRCLVDSDGEVYNELYSFYGDSYGETWLAYRFKPMEVG